MAGDPPVTDAVDIARALLERARAAGRDPRALDRLVELSNIVPELLAEIEVLRRRVQVKPPSVLIH